MERFLLSFLIVNNTPPYILHFVYSFCSGHLGCLHSWLSWIMLWACCRLFQTLLSILFWYIYIEVGLLDYTAVLILYFVYCFIEAHHFTVPWKISQVFQILIFCFDSSHPNGYLVTSHCSDMHFCLLVMLSTFSCACLSLYIIYGEMFISPWPTFFTQFIFVIVEVVVLLYSGY